jgi:hypothetical protein
MTDNPGTERANLIRTAVTNNAPADVRATLQSIVDMAEQAYGDCGYYDPEMDADDPDGWPRRCVSYCDCGWGTMWAGAVLDEIGRILGVLPHGE